MADGPLILPFAGVRPAFADGAPRRCADTASVLGRVTAGAGLTLGPHAVIRADGETVTVGRAFWLGAGATVHIAHGRYATVIGDGVVVGANAVVHACVVHDDCVIEADAVILDGSTVGAGVLLEAGSTVFPRSELEPGHRYGGSPAVKIAPISPGERAARAEAVRTAATDPAPRPALGAPALGEKNFVADTVHIAGAVELAPGASVFFGCRLSANTIVVGENSNIQDNCVAACGSGDLVVGRDTTLGHNVRMAACTIGQRSLVGMGAVLAPGTRVEDDVLVAAGTHTSDGQVLEAGWLWGGRPAKTLKRMDDSRRAMLSDTVRHYRNYGEAFRAVQAAERERGDITGP